MNKSELPAPPPMREYNNYKRVNQYKDVDWYTQMGELYDESFLSTKIPKTWFGRLFMTEDEKRLEQALIRNKQSCGIIDRLLMPDGFTETTFLHNLDTIAHIYSKHGGIKY